jgi:hypothetical protein
MASVYDEQILKFLHEAGDKGMTVMVLSKNVFNENTSLFCELSFDEVYRYVRSYIYKNSKSADSLVELAGRRGCYRINKAKASQLMLHFLDEETTETDCIEQNDEDLSLSLF